jgi:hypothetical protein
MFLTGLASIGLTGGMIGSSMSVILSRNRPLCDTEA